MLMLILILDPQVPNWMWMTLILPSQSCSKPKGRNEMVIDCQARLCRIIKYLHNQVFRRGCYQDENELNDFSIASLGTNINYTDDDFYVFYKRRSQVTVKYWVKWMNHNGQNKEAYIGIQQVVENEHFNDQFWFFAVPQFWLFLSLLYMYLRCFQVILGKNTHGPRLAAILKFRKFYKGKRPKISKIDKFQRSFVAKGCVLQEKVIKQKIFKIAFPTMVIFSTVIYG